MRVSTEKIKKNLLISRNNILNIPNTYDKLDSQYLPQIIKKSPSSPNLIKTLEIEA